MKVLCFILTVILMVEAAALFTYQDTASTVELPNIVFNQLDEGSRQKLETLYEEALGKYKKSNDLMSLLRIADLLLCYGYHHEAAQIYHAVLLRDAQQQRAWHGMSLCYDSLGQWDAAILSYQSVLLQDLKEEDQREIQHRIGEIHQIQGNIAQARTIYESNLLHSPSRYRLIRLLVHAKQFELAQKEFNVLNEDHEADVAMEMQLLNDLSMRILNAPLGMVKINQRYLAWSYQPIDKFKRNLESYYGMSLMELFMPAMRELPQLVPDLYLGKEIKYWDLVKDDETLKRGKDVYEKHNCIICHGAEALGDVGPNLCDDFWLGFGSPGGIYDTITYGRSKSSMPGHQFSLRPDQIRDVTVYLMDLNLRTEKVSGRTKTGKLPEGKHDPLIKHKP